MWISSYRVTCIYQQNTTAPLFSLLTYDVNKDVEAINDIIQNKQQCQTIEYDKQFICCSCEIKENKWKKKVRKHRKKHVYDSMEPVAKKRFVEEIQKR